MSVETFSERSYKKTRDEIKLDFYNSCVDNARKYRYDELTQKEKDFKRKYSWCFRDRPNHNQRRKYIPLMKTSHESHQPHTAISHIGILSGQREPIKQKVVLSSNKSNTGCSQKQYDFNDESPSGSTQVTDLTKSTSTATVDSHTVRSGQRSACSVKRASVASGELPSLVRSRKKSIHDVDSNDRVSYLEELWNKVFSMNADDTTSGRECRRQERELKDTFTGIVMQQFESKPSSNNAGKQLPDINRHGNLKTPSNSKSVTDSKVCSAGQDCETDSGFRTDDTNENEGLEQRKAETSDLLKSQTSSEIQTDENSAVSQPEEDDDINDSTPQPEGEAKSPDTVADDPYLTNTKWPQHKKLRRKSADFSLIKPPFLIASRPRSMSADFQIRGHQWRAANYKLLASRRKGEDCLTKCVRLILTREKIANLKGKKWRDDLKRCRYLRIPKDSIYLSPINSDSESEM